MPNGWAGVLKGCTLGFYAFWGYDYMTMLTEECENPKKDLPNSTMASIFICGFLYIMMGLAMFCVYPMHTLP